MNAGRTITFACASCLVGFALVIGMSLSQTGYASFGLARTLLGGIAISAASFAVIAGCHRLLFRRRLARAHDKIDVLVPRWSAGSVAGHAAIMMAFWAPYLIAFAPGTMGFDTFFQIYQFYPGHEPILQIPWDITESWIPNRFCDHHPIFDTLVFGSFSYASDMLTGSWDAGLALYTLLQMAAMSTTFSLACAYEQRIGARASVRIASYAFFCLAPFIAMYSVSILKDTLYSWLFVLYFLLCTEIVRTEGSLLGRARWAGALVALSVLLCLTKKTGLYVVVAESAFLLVFYRDCWKQLLCAASASLLVMLVALPFVAFPLIDVAPGGKQEALGVAFQQTARYVSDYGDDVMEAEREAIDRVLPYDELAEVYDAQYADEVKYRYKWKTATGEDIASYLRTWVAQGIRHPEAYVASLASVLAPFFDPTVAIGLYTDDGLTIDARADTRFANATEPLREALIGAYDAITRLPAVGFLFSNTLYGWCVPVATFALVATSPNRRRCLSYFPVLLAIGSYLIAPFALSRYLLALVYLAPLLVALADAAYVEHDSRPAESSIMERDGS